MVLFILIAMALASGARAFASSGDPSNEAIVEPGYQANGYQYGIQMDAGSSHTSIFVYKWKPRVFTSLPPTVTQIIDPPLAESESSTPISSYRSNPMDVGESIQPLLDMATSKLKEEGVTDLSTVPVFLGATAGMRMLPPHQVTLIIMYLRDTVKRAGFMYKPEWIRVLSGEEEGAFGWLAANWLIGTFKGESDKTYGALDLGGASTQITFHPKESILAGFFPMSVGRQYHELYTHSYLYYGMNEAQYRFYDNLIGETPDPSTPVSNPCAASGFSKKYTTPQHEDVTFNGTSNWDECTAGLAKLITDTKPSSDKECFHSSHQRCTFAGAYMPEIPPDNDLFAVSTFYYVWDFFQLQTGENSRSSDLDALAAKASSVCSMSKEQFDAYCIKAHGKISAFAYDMCAKAAYSHALLHLGYGMPTSGTPIRVTKKVKGEDPGWAFGAMLYEINKLKWSYSPPTTHDANALQTQVTIVSVFLALVSIVAIAASIMLVRRGACRGKEQVNEQDVYDKF